MRRDQNGFKILGAFEWKILRKIFGPKSNEGEFEVKKQMKSGEDYMEKPQYNRNYEE